MKEVINTHLIRQIKCAPMNCYRKVRVDILVNLYCFLWINMLEIHQFPVIKGKKKKLSLTKIILSLTNASIMVTTLPVLQILDVTRLDT